jgi:hypothetical protein
MSTWDRIKALSPDGIVHECSSPNAPVFDPDVIVPTERFAFHTIAALDAWISAVESGQEEGAAYAAYLATLPSGDPAPVAA